MTQPDQAAVVFPFPRNKSPRHAKQTPPGHRRGNPSRPFHPFWHPFHPFHTPFHTHLALASPMLSETRAASLAFAAAMDWSAVCRAYRPAMLASDSWTCARSTAPTPAHEATTGAAAESYMTASMY